jgi:hypothetical protein
MPTPLLQITPWVDVVVDTIGEDPRASYAERFWLPVLGPTTMFLLRRLADGFDENPSGYELEPAALAGDIGVGTGRGQPSPFRKAIGRGERFGMMQSLGDEELVVRRRMPPLNRVQVSRLSGRHQVAHKRWQAEQLRRSTHPARIGHATRLAHSLLLVGATIDDLYDQLDRWDFDPETTRMAIEAAERRLRTDSGVGAHMGDDASTSNGDVGHSPTISAAS